MWPDRTGFRPIEDRCIIIKKIRSEVECYNCNGNVSTYKDGDFVLFG